MDKRQLPEPELLRKLLRYEPETGDMFWENRPIWMFEGKSEQFRWNNRFAERPAFTATDSEGYRCGAVFGRFFRAHRVVWAIFYGKWPCNQIDHANGNRVDNRISNLRSVAHKENARNKKLPATNSSGIVGVGKSGGKWRAQIKVSGKTISLGTFDTKEEAANARARADHVYGFHPNHGRSVKS